MAKIEDSIDYILRNEGGYVWNRNDPGGATNMGITIGTLSIWMKHRATVAEVKALTKHEATQIYKALYWDACALDNVSNQAVATCIFDTAVLRGVGIAKQYVAETCAHFGNHVSGMSLIDPAKFVAFFEARCEQGFQAIAAGRPKSRGFLKGWLSRAKRMLTLLKRP